ncbi:MAG: hypothetical protein WBA82_10455 [Castellaniella sp.]|uniref:hypothetical protein n=1 Tax=Castellaniella sp. TaxID=1955812 RepID=UPI003C787E74
MRQTARDFQEIVWPIARNADLIGGGDLISVEANEQRNSRDELDYIAGIDAWHIAQSNRQMRGLASRVQRCTQSFDNFTIRYSLASGQRTEYEKRLEAIHSSLNGGPNWLYPDLTVQAYIHSSTDELLSWAVIQTKNLFLEIERLHVSGEIEYPEYESDYGFRQAPDGNTFFFICWDYLERAGVW